MGFNLMAAAAVPVVTASGERTQKEVFEDERRTYIAIAEKCAHTICAEVTVTETAFDTLANELVIPANMPPRVAALLKEVYARSELIARGEVRHFADRFPVVWGTATVTGAMPKWLFYANLARVCGWFTSFGCVYDGDTCAFEHTCVACSGEHGVLDFEINANGTDVFVCPTMQYLSDAGFDVMEVDGDMMASVLAMRKAAVQSTDSEAAAPTEVPVTSV